MSPKYCLLAVEGPHDQAAITRLLELSGLKKFNGDAKKLDPFWEGFIPTYPKKGNLYTRMDMPTILTSPTHSVAVYWGEGNNLSPNLIAIATNHKRYAQEIHAFGLIVDADKSQPPLVAKKWASSLLSIFPTLSTQAGNITDGTPRTGMYVLPDNTRSGTLDAILVDCAKIVYPDHQKGATQFLDSLDAVHTKHWRGFARDKALVATIVSVLAPGMANTSSIAQDKWISTQTMSNNALIQLHNFLKNLLELP